MAYQVNGTTRISDTSVVSGTFNGTTVDGTIVYGSTGIRLPSVSSDAGRPSSPAVGLMIWRTDTKKIELWDGTQWSGVGGAGVQQTFAQTLGTFNYTGGDQTVAIPTTATNTAPVTAVRVKMWGGGGTGGGRCSDGTSGADGSCGSFVDAVFAVTAGETLTIRVGGGQTYNGNDGNCLVQSAINYGANSCSNQGGTGDGGGANGNSGGTGGGGSSIWRGSTELIRAAGGSGGGGCGYGGTRTQAAAASSEGGGGGGGGRGNGGAGGSGGTNCGGGGGGGSGSSQNQGGGFSGAKNTSFVPTNTTVYTTTGSPQNTQPGSGRTPAGTSDAAYATNVATGGIGSSASGSNSAGARGGGPGRVVILI